MMLGLCVATPSSLLKRDAGLLNMAMVAMFGLMLVAIKSFCFIDLFGRFLMAQSRPAFALAINAMTTSAGTRSIFL